MGKDQYGYDIEETKTPTIADEVIGKNIIGWRVKDRVLRIVIDGEKYVEVSASGNHLNFHIDQFR